MANDTARGEISPITFFSVVVQLFISMTFVLTASEHAEGSWFRVFVQVYLLFMILLYTGGMLWMLWKKAVAKKAATTSSHTPAQE